MQTNTANAEPRPDAPLPLTSLVGRDQDLHAVSDLLIRQGDRLVTLTGPAGTGKTRLALAVAEYLAPAFEHAIVFVDLAPLRDAGLVVRTIADRLGLREVASQSPFQQVIDVLSGRRLLLILDNFEHLLDAATEIGRLLRASSGLSVLATSREPLHVEPEQVHQLPPLAVPSADLQEPNALASVPSVALFVERARAVKPSFDLDTHSAPAVAELCRRLDGLPLAIELAAARSGGLSIDALVDRLTGRLDILRSVARDRPARHTTLEAAMNWSYELLPVAEQMLLRRLSVFAGGWALEAAEGVCSAQPLAPAMVVDLLTSLVDRSLVVVDQVEGRARYRLLETIRQFAAVRLTHHGESESTSTRHGRWFREMTEPVPLIRSRRVLALQSDHDNLRAALHTALQRRDAELGVRLAGGLWGLWYLRSFYTEGRAWLAAMLALPGADSAAARPMALTAAAHLAYCQGDLTAANTLVQQAIAGFSAARDEAGVGSALHVLGLITYASGETHQATRSFEDALAIGERVANPLLSAYARGGLSLMYLEAGDFEPAAACATANLRFFEGQADVWGVAASSLRLGLVATRQRQLARATELFNRALSAYREVGDKQGMIRALVGLADTAEAAGDREGARQYMVEGLHVARRAGDRLGLARVLEGLARLLGGAQPERAVRLLGLAQHLRATTSTSMLPSERQQIDSWLALTRRRLGASSFEAELSVGRALTLDEALQTASTEVVTSDGRAVLSRREREVALLIAEGRTNHQIAQALHIADRTAEHHVENILAKLGLASRTQIGVWAVQQDMAPSGRDHRHRRME